MYNIQNDLEEYNNEDHASIKEIRDTFVKSSAKFDIFKYISEKSSDSMIGIQPGLKYLLLETLFRHTILELYTVFFDTDPDSIAHIIKKLKKNIGIKATRDNNLEAKKLLGMHTSFKKNLTTYRNNALGHKSSIQKRKLSENQFSITTANFEELINTTKLFMNAISKEIEPSTAYCHDLFLNGINKDKAISSFFKILSVH